MIDLQQVTADWVKAVQDYYKDNDQLTQIHMRGFFAGMSEREIKGLADKLHNNSVLYPLLPKKINEC